MSKEPGAVQDYISDAQVQQLRLVGGPIHDWNWLLSQWGLLPQCERIGSVLHGAAAVMAFGALVVAAGSLLAQPATQVAKPSQT